MEFCQNTLPYTSVTSFSYFDVFFHSAASAGLHEGFVLGSRDVSDNVNHVIGFSDLIDLWVIQIKKPMNFSNK